jgi:hypothetical protein
LEKTNNAGLVKPNIPQGSTGGCAFLYTDMPLEWVDFFSFQNIELLIFFLNILMDGDFYAIIYQ